MGPLETYPPDCSSYHDVGINYVGVFANFATGQSWMRIYVTTKFERDCETKSECMPACRNLVGSNIISKLIMSSTVKNRGRDLIQDILYLSEWFIKAAQREQQTPK